MPVAIAQGAAVLGLFCVVGRLFVAPSDDVVVWLFFRDASQQHIAFSQQFYAA